VGNCQPLPWQRERRRGRRGRAALHIQAAHQEAINALNDLVHAKDAKARAMGDLVTAAQEIC